MRRAGLHGRSRRTGPTYIGLFVVVLAFAWPLHAQNSTTAEVKAAFLFNFARFTEWPSESFATPTSPLVVGVMGDETMRLTLETLSKGKQIGGRSLATKNVQDPKDLGDVHMVFVGGSSGAKALDLLKAVNGLPILTVGDVDRFCDKGGMITFLVEQNRVRFEIRYDATEHARLRVSSRVLTLAKTVHGKN